MRTLLDLVLPLSCGGCGLPGLAWCSECARALDAGPIRIRPRLDPGVPCWALAPYAGPARRAVLAAKERGRRDLAEPIGRATAAALSGMRTPGSALALIPAPSRRAAARRRGGDPVLRAAHAAARWLSDSQVLPILCLSPGVRDSVGLTSTQRRRNLQGRVRVSPGWRPPWPTCANVEVVLLDDVATTGATARESVRALTRAGARPDVVLVTCAA
ncbi:ComF family protein [Nocardia takedensis]|uniref:ComF family protein n=1 Tax=Nocardia takedensis TaxID=259390 RepID=UPI000592E2ED|nr:ComF family protein [Nocardia takedensis]